MWNLNKAVSKLLIDLSFYNILVPHPHSWHRLVTVELGWAVRQIYSTLLLLIPCLKNTLCSCRLTANEFPLSSWKAFQEAVQFFGAVDCTNFFYLYFIVLLPGAIFSLMSTYLEESLTNKSDTVRNWQQLTMKLSSHTNKYNKNDSKCICLFMKISICWSLTLWLFPQPQVAESMWNETAKGKLLTCWC